MPTPNIRSSARPFTLDPRYAVGKAVFTGLIGRTEGVPDLEAEALEAALFYAKSQMTKPRGGNDVLRALKIEDKRRRTAL